MDMLLEYLKKQRDARAKKLEAYSAALSALESAQKAVDSFGDMGGIEGEIDELDTYIDDVEKKIAEESAKEPLVAMTILEDTNTNEVVAETATTVGGEAVEGAVDEVVVTCRS